MVAVAVRVVPVLLALAADPLVRVEGSSTCPRPPEVSGQLQRFLPARPADVAADEARVDSVVGGVRVELRRAGDATVVGEKTLARRASCAELAEAIGVVLATWEWPLHPGLVPPIDPAALARPPRPPAAATATASAGPAPPRHDRFRVEADAGARAVLPGPVPGLAVDVVLRARASGWGGRLLVSGSWWTEADLAGGQVSWRRAYAGVGLIKGWEGEHGFVDAHADALGAALFATGRGYDETRAPIAFDPGVAVGVRTGFATARLVRLWIEATLAWWPLHPSLGVDGVGQRVEAAMLEPGVSVGGSLLFGR